MKALLNHCTEIVQRLRATTPPFFLRLMYFFLSVVGLGVTLAGAAGLGISLPSWFDPDWPGELFVVGSVGAFVCKLPVNWDKTSPTDVPCITPPAAVALVKQELDQPRDQNESANPNLTQPLG